MCNPSTLDRTFEELCQNDSTLTISQLFLRSSPSLSRFEHCLASKLAHVVLFIFLYCLHEHRKDLVKIVEKKREENHRWNWNKLFYFSCAVYEFLSRFWNAVDEGTVKIAFLRLFSRMIWANEEYVKSKGKGLMVANINHFFTFQSSDDLKSSASWSRRKLSLMRFSAIFMGLHLYCS